jgi:hypothetical protein
MNDLLAHHQAPLSPFQQAHWGGLAIILVSFALACFLFYVFYASLRAIASEVEKLADDFESADPAEVGPGALCAADALRALLAEAKHMPK